MGNQVLIFTKQDCPLCPAAGNLGERLRKKGLVVQQYDIATPDGLAEASFYAIMATPTIIVIDGDEKQLAGWRGIVPSDDECVKMYNRG